MIKSRDDKDGVDYQCDWCGAVAERVSMAARPDEARKKLEGWEPVGERHRCPTCCRALADLIAVRDLIADPRNRTAGAFARDKDGDEVTPDSAAATCWCLVGALMKITERREPSIRALAAQLPKTQAPMRALIHFNDTKPDEIMPLIERAIEGLR